MDWVEVLNCFDSTMEKIITKWKNRILLNESPDMVLSDIENGVEFEMDLHCLKKVLKFSASLLRQSINKEVYNSTEVKSLSIIKSFSIYFDSYSILLNCFVHLTMSWHFLHSQPWRPFLFRH